MEQAEQATQVLAVPPVPSQVISPRTLRRLILSTIVTTLVVLNTLAFGCFAAYRFSTNSTSKLGKELISQYYMFTELDPHLKEGKGGMNAFEHRGFLINGKTDVDGGDEDGVSTAKPGKKTTEKSGNKPMQKPGGRSDDDGDNEDGRSYDLDRDTTDSGDSRDDDRDKGDTFEDSTLDIPTEDPSNFDIYKLLFPHFPDKQDI